MLRAEGSDEAIDPVRNDSCVRCGGRSNEPQYDRAGANSSASKPHAADCRIQSGPDAEPDYYNHTQPTDNHDPEPDHDDDSEPDHNDDARPGFNSSRGRHQRAGSYPHWDRPVAGFYGLRRRWGSNQYSLRAL